MKPSPKPDALPVKVAGILRSRIQTLQWEFLPSYSDLSRQLRVSRRTVAQAVRLLASQGWVAPRARARTVVVKPHDGKVMEERVGKRAEKTVPASSATTSVHGHLRSEILSGSLPIGEALPKIGHLSRLHHCSHNTVLAALRRLLQESLLHREGRSYVAGPAPVRGPIPGPGEKPVILVVARSPSAWEDICKSTRTGDFGHAFIDQAQRSGYNLLLFCLRNLTHGITSQGGGLPELQSLLRRLGSRYRGGLLAGSRTEFEEVEDWIRTLVAFGQPVAWFDRNAEGLADPIRSPHFIRAFASEERAVETLVEYLREKGHRHVAYPCDLSSESWQSRRLRLLQASGAAGPAPLEILPCPGVPPKEWEDPIASGLLDKLLAVEHAAWPGLQKAFAAFRGDGGEARKAGILEDIDDMENMKSPYAGFIAYTRAARMTPPAPGEPSPLRKQAEMLWNALHYWPAFADGRVTAIITPNDIAARGLVHWLRQARPPARNLLPLVSFDHTFRLSSSGITSVDFGYGGLGYRTYHALTGILPVRPDRKGEYISKPRIVVREETLAIDFPLPAP